ncbi:MAG TPA: hypothetical protein VK988_04710 [Acidimicrobiales bacterium]|nr:hypothetical protein [Acidimicrobiales bacterium]
MRWSGPPPQRRRPRCAALDAAGLAAPLRCSREELWGAGTTWALRLDVSHPPIQPRGSPKADALEALGLAAAAATRRFGPRYSTWHVIAALTGGLMLAPQPLPGP